MPADDIPFSSEEPKLWQHANGAVRRLERALDHVPIGTLVHMKIEVPDNRTGQTRTLLWRADRSMSAATARQEIQDQLVVAFLGSVLVVKNTG